MRKARLWGLLWTSFILELQGAPRLEEIKYTRTEGQSLNESCPFNVMKYFSIRKAWQRLGDRGELQTLAITDRVSGRSSKVHKDRCFLEDIPTEGILHVHMADLRVEDSGLYQCVIYQPPKDPILLHHPIRLVVTKDPAQDLAQRSTLPPVTTKARVKAHTSPSPVTQLLTMSTVSLYSPGLGVNPTQGTDVLNMEPRISVISIVTIVVCGILSKSLVFTFLLIATQRSFGR
ncbi:Triggering receptor expressed on myeloid cells 1 [Myotis brandtii]|uniref:Triggering receptor expressed on myeloid cells 1 n=1 Tax=Myotis brandtii TaxID=109478 RepID=S7QFD0_MYOBR|nr:PREDICTED: triggering receptor expressed on myeloid cells 1 [Myotis brandtii]EPQ19972.1 Triggering receptor expressed on myeloid cells 1 [Myotis brandtii]